MKKGTLAQSLSVYEKILKNAWKTTWTHKELWFVGLFAGFAYSGTVLQNVFENVLRVRPADEISVETFEQSVAAASYITSYGRALVGLPAGRMTLVVVAALVILAFLVYLAVTAQHLLLEGIHRATKRKKRLTIGQMLAERKHVHFWRLFAIDAIILIATIIIVAGSAIPLTLILSENVLGNAIVYTAMYAIILPLLFVVNIGGMFTLIHAVRRNDGIDQAYHRTVQVVSKHWLVAAEIAIILLFVNLIGVLAFLFAASIGSLLIAPFFLAAVSLGSVSLMSLIGFMTFLAGLVLYLAFFGAFTVFNYATWTELVERVERYGAMPAVEGMMRVFHRK